MKDSKMLLFGFHTDFTRTPYKGRLHKENMELSRGMIKGLQPP